MRFRIETYNSKGRFWREGRGRLFRFPIRSETDARMEMIFRSQINPETIYRLMRDDKEIIDGMQDGMYLPRNSEYWVADLIYRDGWTQSWLAKEGR